MENLPSYVDLRDYCTELSQITNVSVDDIFELVTCVFISVRKGFLESYKGFLIIEEQLAQKMNEAQKANKQYLA